MSKAAKRYARAFFQLTSEQEELDDTRQDMLALRDISSRSADFQQFIKNPVLPSDQQKTVLQSLFEAAHPSTLRFLQFLVDKKRLGDMTSICDFFEQFYCAKNNILKVTITSASPLDEEQLSVLQERLESRFNKTIEAIAMLDPTLLGGFRVKVGDTIHDYSIQAQLKRLREQLINA